MIQRLQARREEGGFTLIELLIVIIILGILAAIVVFAVSSTRKDSVASACKTDFKSIELSMEAVNTKMGLYPTTANVNSRTGSGTTADPYVITTKTGTANYLLADNAASNGALLKTWPTSSDYQFYYTSGGTPDGKTGTLSVLKAGIPVGSSNTAADCESLT